MQGFIRLEIELSNPILSKVICSIHNGMVRYQIDGKYIPFCPFSINVIFLRDPERRIDTQDDLSTIAQLICADRDEIRRMVEGCDLTNGYIVSKAWIKDVCMTPCEVSKIKLNIKDSVDSHDWKFGQFSG